MQKEINFIPIDYDYFDYKGKTYAKIFGKTDKQKKVCIIDSCDIYFWAILKKNANESRIKKIQEKIGRIKIEKSGRISKVLKTEIHNKKFLGNPVRAIKIFISNYKDAHSIADKIDFKEIIKRREYDLGFVTKYIIERKLNPLIWHKIKGEELNNSPEFGGIDNSLGLDLVLKVESITRSDKQPLFNPRILAYDIETDEFEIGKGKILMISLVGEDFQKVLTWKGSKTKKSYVENFKDEESMIEAFIKHIKDYNPDILTGYFSDGFDLPYLRARAEKNKIKLNLGIDNSQPIFSRSNLLTGKIKGIVHIDLLRFIRTAYSQYLQSETLSLNEVASELLGETKTNWEHKHSSKIDSKQWEDYFDYNLQDSLLTYKLTEKAWPDLREFSRIIKEPLFDISRDGMSANVENYIIHNLEKFNEIIEKRPTHDEIGKRRSEPRYEGAYVFQPTPGLYENIVFFDFTSMYASVIITYNLSKSTYLSKEKFSKKAGFFPLLLNEVIEKRKKYKKEFNEKKDNLSKARSNAFKLLANAAYGYQGFFGARYYCLEAAASTAALARKHIKQAISDIEKKGYEVVYSDTDSISLLQGKSTKSEIKALLKEINEKLPGIMELDLEGFFKRGIWVTKRTGEFGAKKKYALLDENNNLKIRGFETVRRDWCNLARTTQNRILQLILEDGNEKRALESLKKIIKQIKERQIQLNQLIIRTQLKKPIEEYKSISPHVTAAKKMREKNLPVNIGKLIEYYIAESKDKKALVRERTKLPDEPGNYDIEYYLNNQILPAVENIFEVFKIDLKQVLDGKKQTCLGDF
jgi:DNA polymerase, archaea type